MAARRSGSLLRGEEGLVLPSVLMLVAVLAAVGASSMNATLAELRIADAYYKSAAVFHIAEAGLVHGRHELADGDGRHDFAAIAAPATLFSSRGFHGGSYTVTAAPVAGATPARVRLRSFACYPAASPCPRAHSRTALETLVEQGAAGRLRRLAWRRLD